MKLTKRERRMVEICRNTKSPTLWGDLLEASSLYGNNEAAWFALFKLVTKLSSALERKRGKRVRRWAVVAGEVLVEDKRGVLLFSHKADAMLHALDNERCVSVAVELPKKAKGPQ